MLIGPVVLQIADSQMNLRKWIQGYFSFEPLQHSRNSVWHSCEPRRLAHIIHVNKQVVPLVRWLGRRTFQIKNWKRTTETMQQLNPCQACVQQRKFKHDSPRVWQNIKLSGEIFCVLTPLSTSQGNRKYRSSGIKRKTSGVPYRFAYFLAPPLRRRRQHFR